MIKLMILNQSRGNFEKIFILIKSTYRQTFYLPKNILLKKIKK